jgi:tetratricopeptide (TPR) repeat protein
LFNVNVCLHNLGDIAARLGDDAVARAYHEEELAIGRELLGGTETEFGVIHDRLGEIEMRAGNLELAAQHFQEALRQDEHLDDAVLLPHYRANLLVVQGEMARLRGVRAEAMRLYQEALAIFEPAPTPYNHNGREYIDCTRARLAMVSERLDADAPPAPVEVITVSLHAKRRWWPWGGR